MTYRLNLGKILEKSFESKYSILRRFILSNPGITRKDIESDFSRKITGHSNFINYLVKLNYKTQQPPLHLNLIDKGYGTIEEHNITRHCPKCASNFYHTDLFRLPWITQCPIHLNELATICPECQQKWPSWSELFTRNCQCCSRTIANPSNINDDLHEYPVIAKLFDFIMYGEHSNTYLESSLDMPERITSITISHPNYPSYQVVRHPRISRSELIKLGIKITPVKLKKFRISQPIQWPFEPNLSSSWQTTHSWSAQVRFDVIKKVYSKLLLAISTEHRLWIFDYSRMKRLLVSMHPRLCPYCVPFSIWFFLVSSVPYKYKYNPDVDGNGLYGADRYFKLTKPIPMDFLKEGDKSYKISKSFQKWLYKRDLQTSFKSIFSYTSKAFKNYKLINSNKEGMNELPDTFNNIDRSILFYSNEDKSSVCVLYLEEKLLENFIIPKLSGAFRNCESFHRLIEKDIMLNFEKGLEGPSQFYGMTYNQLLTLEYGYERHYKYKATGSSFMTEANH